jgi:hypothetical protein
MDYPYDLGCYSRKVTTASAEAQRWFDRGLNWCFGYHHEEAAACFEKALAADPNCAMAHWGVGYAAGMIASPRRPAPAPATRRRSSRAGRTLGEIDQLAADARRTSEACQSAHAPGHLPVMIAVGQRRRQPVPC